MTQQNDFLKQQIDTAQLIKRMVQGATIGLILISLFLFSADEPAPEWGPFWMVHPLIIVPLAGAMGGLCHYLIMHFYKQVGVSKTIAAICSAVVFIIGLYMGIVLGLDGTMWD